MFNFQDVVVSKKSLSYSDSGVNIVEGNRLIDEIKPFVKDTVRKGVLNGLGNFASLFELPVEKYKKPVLVSGTDGVGTKLKLALKMDKHDSIGIDLVAMCVNDIIVTGAEPLFFLDYYATGSLSVSQAKRVIYGIAEGCKQAGCALVGGETAEMPGMYSGGDYDLAGFCVGVVEKDKIINSSRVCVGDKLIAIGSSGLHSNGYSLARHILDVKSISLNSAFEHHTIGNQLLTPTKIYVKTILRLLEDFDIHSIVHITGGGFTENVPRVLPDYTNAALDLNSWKLPAIFDFLQKEGNVSQAEMLRTFNCGVGMILAVKSQDEESVLKELNNLGEKAWKVGSIESSDVAKPSVRYVF